LIFDIKVHTSYQGVWSWDQLIKSWYDAFSHSLSICWLIIWIVTPIGFLKSVEILITLIIQKANQVKKLNETNSPLIHCATYNKCSKSQQRCVAG
jgi:hypothetical protein